MKYEPDSRSTSTVVRVQPTSTVALAFIAIAIISIFTAMGISEHQSMNTEGENMQQSLDILIERVYIQAQADALNGQLRIVPTTDGDFRWIDSPWDDGRDPHFETLSEYRAWRM